MTRKKTKKPRAFVRPRDPEGIAKAKRKIARAWGHPAGTPVTYYPIRKRGGDLGGEPLRTSTRTVAFLSGAGVAVFLDGKPGFVLVSHLALRSTRESQP